MLVPSSTPTTMAKVHQPHDKLFKASFGKKLVTKDFLLSRLPKDILAKIDLKSLKRENASFIDEHLKAYYSDVVFSVKIGGQDAYIYFLLEGQTTPDPLIPVRILEYKTAIMRYDIEQNKTQGGRKLPIVYCKVIYTGKKKWKDPKRLLDAFANPELVSRMFEDDFLIPLNTETKDKIMGDGKASIAELILREGWREDFCKILEKNEELQRKILQAPYTKELFLYMIDKDKHSVDKILEKFPNLDPKIKKKVMSGLERIEQKGIAKGKKEGIAKGMEKGIKKGLKQGINMIKELLNLGHLTKEQAQYALKSIRKN